MHKKIVVAAYGWLVLSGVLHFVVDVVSQQMRGTRTPGAETTLYYGLHSAFALGQVVFGLFGLFLAWRAAGLLRETPVLLLSLAAGIAWLELTLLFMTYWQPKVNVVVFCALIVVALVTRTRT